ncbi:MAG: hypothetical protein EXR77_05075 [Myxococcales bacterium]|nr:hypothetical protein [Myxococcales bacterium]
MFWFRFSPILAPRLPAGCSAVFVFILAACATPPPATPAATDTAQVKQVDATAVETSADTSARVQYYAAKLSFHGGPWNGFVHEWERDLTQIDSVLIYGNTHLTPPAVAFAMQDHMSLPATSKTGKPTLVPLDFQLRFGILIEAVGFPVHTGKTGSFPISCKSPMVQVNFDTWSYRSTCPSATGSFEIDQWSASPGGKFSGTTKGRAPMYFFDSLHNDDCKAADTALTCKATDKWVDFEASFDFVVPDLNKNSAPDAFP